MIYEYLQRGVAGGAVAGIAYGIYMVFVGHPLSEYVHDAGHDHGAHAHDAGHAVSETTTAIVSAGSGLLWAVFLGGMFALALYLLEPALPGRDGVKAYVLASAGFLTVSAVPWLVLPPAAPGAEQLYAVEPRLTMYLGLVVLGAITAAAAIMAYKRAVDRSIGLGVAAAAVPILGVVVVVPLVTPTVVTHPELPGKLVSAYQALAALSQAAIWLLIAGTFNALRRRTSEFEDESAAPDAEVLAG